EAAEAPGPGGGYEAERDREHEDEDDREDEARDRDAAERDEHHQTVDRRVPFDRRHDPEGDAEQHRDHERRPGELDRAREPVADDFDDRLMPNERFPETEVRRIPEPADVLERQRIAQAELLAQARDELLLCGPVA